jgi:hypothetical protein
MSYGKRIYVLDSSSLITPYRNYYAPSIAPTFWQKLRGLIRQGTVCTIDKVRDEIFRIDDDLKDWFKKTFDASPVPFSKRRQNNNLFAFGEAIELSSYQQIMDWIRENDHFEENAKNKFKSSDIADAFLVAFCKAHNLILVTEEKYNPNIKKRIPIPNVCHAFSVLYIGLFDMMKELSIQL